MKRTALIGLLFLGLYSRAYCQKVEELNPSGFTHKYVVNHLKYIEDLSDTTRLHYITGLRVSGPAHKLQNLIAWFDLLEIKARLLGADAYCVQSYVDTDTHAELVVKLYFGGDSYLRANEQKQLSNSAILFNQLRHQADTAYFYANGQLKTFSPRGYYQVALLLNEKKTITLTNEGVGQERTVQFKKAKKARFFILAANKSAFNPKIPKGQLEISEISWNFNNMDGRIAELGYDAGRLLLAAYRQL